MNAAQRKLITGGLSKPSRCRATRATCQPSLQDRRKLAQVPGTTCHGCYALKGRYRFPNVMEAMMQTCQHKPARWARTMAADINARGNWFRWHDSGDIQASSTC